MRSGLCVMRRGQRHLTVLVTTLTLLGGLLQATPASAAAGRPAEPVARPAKVSAAPDGLAAMRDARRQRSRVEITSDRTAFSQTFANPDGTTTYVASAQPRWVARKTSWVRASAELVRGSDGTWSPAAAEAGLALSGGRTRVLATVRSGRHWMSVSWPSKLPLPHVSGASATYPGVFAGVNLVVTARVSGSFEETLVVHTAAAAKDPQLRDLELGVSLSRGLRQHARKDGIVVVRDAAGKVLFSSPAPVAWDSATGAATAAASTVAGPGRAAHVAKVGVSYGAHSVRMQVPPGLLSGSSTVFPVYVDPSYTVTQSWEAYGELQSAFPTTNDISNTSDGKVAVGYAGSNIDRGAYVFGLPAASDGPNTSVLSATLADEVLTAGSASSTSHTVNLYYTDQYTSTSTWNSPPAQFAGPAAVTFTTASTSPNQMVSWNVAGWVQADENATGQGWEFSTQLINASETSASQFVEFSANPTLSITYDHAPAQPGYPVLTPQSWAANGSLYTSSLTPSFSDTTTDADGDPITYQFQVLKGSTVIESGSSASVASGTARLVEQHHNPGQRHHVHRAGTRV